MSKNVILTYSKVNYNFDLLSGTTVTDMMKMKLRKQETTKR